MPSVRVIQDEMMNVRTASTSETENQKMARSLLGDDLYRILTNPRREYSRGGYIAGASWSDWATLINQVGISASSAAETISRLTVQMTDEYVADYRITAAEPTYYPTQTLTWSLAE